MQHTILLVDDEEDVVSLVRYNLDRAGFAVRVAMNGPKAMDSVRDVRPDAVILDLNLPGMSGLEVCQSLRANASTRAVPILMLTARGQARDRIEGFELGADDYVTKPFSPKELILRLHAILRRTGQAARDTVETFDGFELDRQQMEIRMDGQRLDLTNTEFKVLSMLMEQRGRVLSREFLLNDIWGYRNNVDTRTVDTHMRRLREKLGKHSNRIETVRGAGYRFSVEDL